MSVFSIEVHHNAVHNHIDGHFASLDSSPFDPVFWFLHSMFHFIWYMFKNNQRARGVDPQRDYPQGPTVPQGHEFFQQMNFMPLLRPITNLASFSDRYDRIVRYAPLPRCPLCGGSPYLVCLQGVCVARSRGPVGGAPTAVRAAGLRPVVRVLRGKRSISNANNRNSRFMQTHDEAISTLDKSYLNTYMINGHYSPKEWVYLNVRVIYERPHDVDALFNSTTIERDLYNPSNFKNNGKEMGLQNRVFYNKKCTPVRSGATKVFVQSDGLNYHGKYKEFTIVDERQAVSSAIVQVAVRRPNSEESTETYLSAYDSCGRVCRPACPVNDRSSSAYKACSGSFRITKEYPLEYSQSYEAAITSLWHLNLDGKGPLFRNKFSPITFICDHQNAWPWMPK